jgi:2-polyprenyl-3-methyl-5-hydroxy-6-metoxy-1,4-benzoquinol methylase
MALQPGRDAAELRDLYDEEYFDEFDLTGRDTKADRGFEAAVRVRLIRCYRDSGRLLEIGAAAGHFLNAARAAGFDPLGIEPSEAIAEAARKRFGVEIITGGVEEVELEPGSFDVACAWHVLEHIADPLPTLVRVLPALRPGAHLFVEVPNFGSVRARRERAAWPSLHLRHHVGQYTPSAIAALLARAGLVDVSTVTVPFAVYKRSLRAILSYGKHASILRGWPVGPHPWKHELLRAVARAPA